MKRKGDKRRARKEREQKKKRSADERRRQLEKVAERHLDELERLLPGGSAELWLEFPDLELLGMTIHCIINVFDQGWPQYMRRRHPKVTCLLDLAMRKNNDASTAVHCLVFGAGAWANSGFPTLRTTEATAAALALTDAPWTDELFPWKAVRIALPKDTFFDGAKKDPEPFTSLLIDSDSCDRTRVLGFYENNMAMPLMVDEKDLLIGGDRARLIRNFIASMIRVVEDGSLESVSVPHHPSRRWRLPGMLPETLDFEVSSPVQIRQNLAGVVRGVSRGESPFGKYQWLVRGHWRDQAWGPGLELRRRRWIAPYWKGPTDAPILKRDYYVQSSGDAS